MDRIFVLMKKIKLIGGCLPLPRGYIHVSDHNIQIFSPLNCFNANQSQTLYVLLFGRGNESLKKGKPKFV